MRTLLDTTVIVAGLVEAHPMHERAFPWLKHVRKKNVELSIAAHSLAESYAVLTSLPIKPRISPDIAWRLIGENITHFGNIISLGPAEYQSTIVQAARAGLIGGIIYDALIVSAAKKAKVEQLLTFNPDHFLRVWPEGKSIIVSP